MVEYRAFLIGKDGHFYDAVPLVCADDTEAIQKAKQIFNSHDIELWQSDRLVATLKAISNQTSKKM